MYLLPPRCFNCRTLPRGDLFGFLSTLKRHRSHSNSISRISKVPSKQYSQFSQPPWSTHSRVTIPKMAPRPALEKQYMASKPAKQISEPRPSSSILLISPTNQILLLQRVRASSSFPSAHVFPGGNLSSTDGPIPPPGTPERHLDSDVYRIGAIRECFEESGILLVKKNDGSGELIEVEESVREEGRKDVHSGKIGFGEWVEKQGGVMDIESLHPFTRWITPTNIPKRFTTQMYIYFLPLDQPSAHQPTKSVIPIPTSDGGLEHTNALFAPCSTWLSQARKNEIILFPPQFYLMYLLSPFLSPPNLTIPITQHITTTQLQKQRDQVLEFLKGDGGDGKGVVWKDKVMSPMGLLMTKDGRSVLRVDRPGKELEGSGRGGDEKRVVLVRFGKEGPRDLEVRDRREVLIEEREKEKL